MTHVHCACWPECCCWCEVGLPAALVGWQDRAADGRPIDVVLGP